MTTRFALFASLALCAAPTACSDGGSSSPPSGGGYGGVGGSGVAGDGGPAGVGGGNTGGEGGSGGSGATGGSGGSPVSTKYGFVSLVQSVLEIQGTEYDSHSISAAFFDTAGTSSDWDCSQTNQGSCAISDCTGTTYDGGAPAEPQSSAGTLHIKVGGTTVDMAPQSGNTYAAVTGQTRLWNVGQTLEINADGAAVPAFSSSIVGVDPVLVSSPAFPSAGTQMVIQRTQDLTVTWSGGGAGKLFVILGGATSPGPQANTVSATCTFAASAGNAVIPASVVAAIPAGYSGSLTVYGGDKATVTAGDWSIVVQEYVPAVLSTGYTAAALATYQ